MGSLSYFRYIYLESLAISIVLLLQGRCFFAYCLLLDTHLSSVATDVLFSHYYITVSQQFGLFLSFNFYNVSVFFSVVGL
jgi:hypothetical protein